MLKVYVVEWFSYLELELNLSHATDDDCVDFMRRVEEFVLRFGIVCLFVFHLFLDGFCCSFQLVYLSCMWWIFHGNSCWS